MSTASCAISHLPLTFKTPIRAFLLLKIDNTVDIPCLFPSAAYVPLSLGVAGVYDEYKRADFEHHTPLPHKIPGFENASLQDTMNAISYSASGNKTVFSLPGFSQLISGELSVAFIREDIYQAALNTCAQKVDRAALREDLEKIQFNLSFALSSATKVEDENQFNLGMRLNVSPKSFLYEALRPRENDALFYAVQPYRAALLESLTKDSSKSISDNTINLAEELAQFCAFNRTLERMGMLWMPSAYSASNDDLLNLHSRFNSSVQKIIKRELKALNGEAGSIKPFKPPR